MNIFVVEDERWALAELAQLFQVYETRHQVFAFENGDDALAAAVKIRPQLVVTDINMPGIDGLELIEQLYRLDPAIKCMILSVHDQFEYARQGMKYGVSDYLLKPVKKDVLYKAVDNAIAAIETDVKRTEEWLNGSIAQMLLTSDVPDHAAFRAVNSSDCYIVLLLLETTGTLKGWNQTWFHMADLKRRFATSSTHNQDVFGVDLNCRQRVLLIPQTDPAQSGAIHSQLSQIFHQLQLLPVPAHLGYAFKSGACPLFEAFAALKSDMEEQIAFAQPTFVVPGSKQRGLELDGIWEKVRVMETHFKKGDLFKGRSVLRQLLKQFEQQRVTKHQLKLFIHDMLYSLKFKWLTARKGMISIHEVQEEAGTLNGLVDFERLFEWLDETIVALYCGQEPDDLNPKGLIPVLLQQIHQHYQGTISLQQFAAEHHVSLGYLSRMFKSQTGITFSDYVANYRIRKAKELLNAGVERLQEVSELVGYEDAKHFSALFKKLVGETPMMYARRRKQSDVSLSRSTRNNQRQ
ncbi:response regulator transcription factor [Paenibacillus piri]|uniref:Response regulator n=1 Tax=Paenibacillus piri TaxID=2547395 RepID=A0A4R5KV39_9BACL|nr:response regulator [Paenibacillus piri]TDF99803.1 response regulator [Paenibacillus piri]